MSKIEIPVGIKGKIPFSRKNNLGAASFCRTLPLVRKRVLETKKGEAMFTFEEVVTIARMFTFLSLKKIDKEKR